MQFLALTLVVVEIIICILIYFGCVYIRRRRQQLCDQQRQASTDDPHNAGSSGRTCGTKKILVFVPYTVAKTFLGKTAVMSLTCANCLKVFKDEDETLRLIPTCGHVFHPTCLVDPCSPLCPYCQARPKSELEGEGGKGEEVLEIKVVEEKMIRLSQEVTKKMILHAKLVLPTGKLCSPAQFLS